VDLMTWNMGHGSPGARRAPSDQQWAAVAALRPDIVLAQETREPEIDGYNAVFSRYPRTGWGAAVAIRAEYGEVTVVQTDHPGLLTCCLVERAAGPAIFAASVHVPAEENARAWLREVAFMEIAGRGPTVIGGDFNAGPSIGVSPVTVSDELDVQELTSSEPERNSLVRPQHPGTTFQIDHVFGRAWSRQEPMCVLPFADVGGPQLSDHNALWVSLAELDRQVVSELVAPLKPA
jgi:endonuclease/exonuclease/phosphatase family metal-dependent hydrolase